jgi:PAS domain S-box-containing protein
MDFSLLTILFIIIIALLLLYIYLQNRDNLALETRLKNIEPSQKSSNKSIGEWSYEESSGAFNLASKLYPFFEFDRYESNITLEKFLSKVHPQDRQFLQLHFEQAKKNSRACDITFRVLTRDGNHKILHLTGRSNSKSILEGTIQDITKYKQNERTLEMLQFAIDHFHDSSIWIKESGDIVYVNQTTKDQTGFSEEELLIIKIWSLAPEMQKEQFALFWEKLEKYGKTTFETVFKRKDGSSYPVEISASLIEYDGESYAITFDRDITHRVVTHQKLKQYNSELQAKVQAEMIKRLDDQKMLIQQSKMAAMGDMIGAIAHQWRQPLNAISVIVQQVSDDYEYNELTKETLTHNVNNVLMKIEYMSKTIDDFRHFFRPDKEMVYFDVKAEIEHALSIISAKIKNHAITITIPDESFTVLGYANEFKQVILNILSNAHDAILDRQKNSALKGEIIISLEDQTIKISDNGGGIPAHVAERIFEPYFTTKGENGTGIGLHMCKRIIEDNMRGHLSYQHINEGTQMSITLPQTLRKGF